MRRVLQRANEKLGTNWTLHDARHTAATRMAGDERLTLAEVQTILRHAHLDTTGHYLTARVEDLHDKLVEHYTKPRPQRSYPAGYDPADGAVGGIMPDPGRRAARDHRPPTTTQGAHGRPGAPASTAAAA